MGERRNCTNHTIRTPLRRVRSLTVDERAELCDVRHVASSARSSRFSGAQPCATATDSQHRLRGSVRSAL